MPEEKKKLMVKCPTCKKEFSYYESKFRPFCSKRCKMIDLGHWLSEDYSVEGENGKDLENDEDLELD